jgi:hypothetical protein
MTYGSRDCVFVIDGMDAIEAGFHFAGICGVSPRKWTLKQLWMMANGKISVGRRENLELANLVWGLSEIDWECYLLYGEMSPSGKGGPVQLKPELQAKIDEEVQRIRKENPDLPQFRPQDMKG